MQQDRDGRHSFGDRKYQGRQERSQAPDDETAKTEAKMLETIQTAAEEVDGSAAPPSCTGVHVAAPSVVVVTVKPASHRHLWPVPGAPTSAHVPLVPQSGEARHPSVS